MYFLRYTDVSNVRKITFSIPNAKIAFVKSAIQ